MVERHIRAKGIKDPAVLRAMLAVPRHKFVPTDFIKVAYRDAPLSIGYGQTVSQPYIVAYMTEVAAIAPGDKILEIGTGSGYQTAVLAELTQDKNIYTVELLPELAWRSQELLVSLGYQGIQFKIGDGAKGWADHAPYDVIMVTAAPESIPQTLIDQLAPNGRMVIPVGHGQQELLLLKKTSTGIVATKQMRVNFVPLRSRADIYKERHAGFL